MNTFAIVVRDFAKAAGAHARVRRGDEWDQGASLRTFSSGLSPCSVGSRTISSAHGDGVFLRF